LPTITTSRHHPHPHLLLLLLALVVTEGLCFIILISREKELGENGDDEDYYYDYYQGIIASTTSILE
jgi:hypothetical protein